LPSGASREGAPYPGGTSITDLKEARDLINKMNRPGIAPKVLFRAQSQVLVWSIFQMIVCIPSWLGRERFSHLPQSWHPPFCCRCVQTRPGTGFPPVQFSC
jgi:hypothetical protein